MRIVFMGTPDFAQRSLDALYAAGREVVGVFTQPDRPRGRGMKLLPCAVKSAALAQGTPVFQPDKLRDGAALAILRELRPDILAVVAYGRILPVELLELPKYGAVNIHGSLLPKYRGAAPIQHAVLNGETVTGVTAMHLSQGMDEGDIIALRQTPIGPEETSGELFTRLADLGAELLLETLDRLEAGTAARTPQDGALATYAPPITKDMVPICWDRPAQAVANQIRALDPAPGATAVFAQGTFKLFRPVAEPYDGAAAPGAVLETGENGLVVACGAGALRVRELQAPGGRRMAAADYLRGHKLW